MVGSLRIELSYFALQANAGMTTLAHFPKVYQNIASLAFIGLSVTTPFSESICVAAFMSL